MFKLLTNKKFLLSLAALAFITLIFSLFPKKQALPTIIASNPDSNATQVSVYNPLEITFDQDISPTSFSITSIPSEDWSLSLKSPRVLTLSHTLYLQTNKLYTLNLSYNNQSLTTLTFTTKEERNDPRYLQDVQKDMDRDYPLATKLPYNTPSYRVVYSAPLTLEITLKSQTISSTKAIADIKSWVTQNGGDAAAHKYVIGTGPLPSSAGIPENRNTGTPNPSPTPIPSESLFEYLPAE
ncbi:MAG: Ig-like domain-containing protein [bacterium]